MLKLSTGDDSTFGNYRKLAAAFFGADSPATQFLDARIAEQGADAEVIQAESQMVALLMQLALAGLQAEIGGENG